MRASEERNPQQTYPDYDSEWTRRQGRWMGVRCGECSSPGPAPEISGQPASCYPLVSSSVP